jgi:hypothetical protein
MIPVLERILIRALHAARWYVHQRNAVPRTAPPKEPAK